MKGLLDFTNKPKQRAFFYDRKNKTIGAGGGYNSGKSYAMIAKIHTLLEIFAGSMAIIGRKTYGALEKSVIPTYTSIAHGRNGGSWNGPTITKFADMTAHYTNGSKLWFVTYDDVRKVRGPNIAFAGISQAEEVSHEIFLELKGRCRQWNKESIEDFTLKHGATLQKQLGFIPVPFNQLMCEFNPAPNWVRDEFIFNENKSNTFYDLPTTENIKYHAEGWLDDLKKSYSSEWFSRYVLGSWDSFGGAVYPELDIEKVHGVPEFRIPDHWVRVLGGDYGYRNPASFIAIAVDEHGNAILFREYYNSLSTVKDHATWVKDQGLIDGFPVGDNEKVIIHMDYEIKGDIDKDGKTLWDHYIDEGLHLIEAQKSVMAGIQLTKSMLLPDLDRKFPSWHPRAGEPGSPRLFVMNNRCPNWVNEAKLYIWEPQIEGKDANYQEKPKKFKDHALDAGRYAIMALGKAHALSLPTDKTSEQRYIAARLEMARNAFSSEPEVEQDDY